MMLVVILCCPREKTHGILIKLEFSSLGKQS